MSQNVDRERRVPLFAAFVHDQASPGLDRVVENTWGWSRLGDSWRTTRCTVVCISTWRNVPRNIRNGPIVPRRNVFSGCGCKQPAVRARHDLSRAWRISTCRPNIVLYRLVIETRRVSQMEVCCSTRVSWFGMLLLATREEIHLRERDISHWPTLPFHYPLFPVIHELSISSSNRWVAGWWWPARARRCCSTVPIILLRVNCFLGLSSLLISWKTTIEKRDNLFRFV